MTEGHQKVQIPRYKINYAFLKVFTLIEHTVLDVKFGNFCGINLLMLSDFQCKILTFWTHNRKITSCLVKKKIKKKNLVQLHDQTQAIKQQRDLHFKLVGYFKSFKIISYKKCPIRNP